MYLRKMFRVHENITCSYVTFNKGNQTVAVYYKMLSAKTLPDGYLNDCNNKVTIFQTQKATALFCFINLTLQHQKQYVASPISEGGIFIYSCSAQLISFDRETDSISQEIKCAEHEYMNMSPPLIELATPLIFGTAMFEKTN